MELESMLSRAKTTGRAMYLHNRLRQSLQVKYSKEGGVWEVVGYPKRDVVTLREVVGYAELLKLSSQFFALELGL